MKCIHCGARIPRRAEVCPECGNKVPNEETDSGDVAREKEMEEEDVSCNGDPLSVGGDTSEQTVDDEAVEDDDISNRDDTAQNNVASSDDAEDQQNEAEVGEPAPTEQVDEVELADGIEQVDEAEQVEQSDEGEQPDDAEQPDEGEQVEQGEQPDDAEQSDDAGLTEQLEQVDESDQSDETEVIDQVDESEQSGESDRTEMIDQVDETAPTEQPAQPDETEQPAQPEQTGQQEISQPSQVNTRAVVIAVIIVVVLVAAIVAVVWYMVANNTASDDEERSDSASQEEIVNVGSGNSGNVLGEALYGSSEEVVVASDTFIMPQDLSGNSFAAYTVRAMAQSIPEENADRTRYVSSLQTDSGFLLSEVFDDFPEGLYAIVIETPNGESYVLPRVNYVGDEDLTYSVDEAPVELAVRPPTYEEDNSEKAQQACTLYYAKCLEYEELYGSRTNMSLYLTINGENDDPVEITPLLGFCSAHTVDFNEDGLDELVVVYYSDDTFTDENNSGQNTSGSNASHYIVEVWEYGSGSIHRIYQGIPFVESHTAQVVVSLVSWEDQTYLLGGTYTDDVINMSLYGYTAGALNLEHVISVSDDQQVATLDYQNIADWLTLANQMSLVWSEDMVYVSEDSASSFYKTLRDIRRIANVAPASINDDSTFEYGIYSPDYSADSGADDSFQGTGGNDYSMLFEDNESDYLLPDVDTRYYDESELESMSDYELYLARNEIYARHGRGFDDDSLQEYFENKSWYEQRYSADVFDALEDPLNAYEKANSDLIREIEQERGSSYL